MTIRVLLTGLAALTLSCSGAAQRSETQKNEPPPPPTSGLGSLCGCEATDPVGALVPVPVALGYEALRRAQPVCTGAPNLTVEGVRRAVFGCMSERKTALIHACVKTDDYFCKVQLHSTTMEQRKFISVTTDLQLPEHVRSVYELQGESLTTFYPPTAPKNEPLLCSPQLAEDDPTAGAIWEDAVPEQTRLDWDGLPEAFRQWVCWGPPEAPASVRGNPTSVSFSDAAGRTIRSLRSLRSLETDASAAARRRAPGSPLGETRLRRVVPRAPGATASGR